MIAGAYRKSLLQISLVLLAVIHKLHGVCLNCRSSANTSVQQMEEQFLLDFKQRLLEKLGLKEEPKNVVGQPSDFLEAITRESMKMPADQAKPTPEPPAKITEIYLQPTKSVADRTKNTLFCTFKLEDKRMRNYKVDGIKLWLHVKSKTTKKHLFQIYEKTKWTRQLLLNFTIGPTTPKWFEVKIHPNNDWRKTPWKRLNLQFVGIKDKLGHHILSSDDRNLPRLQVTPRFTKTRSTKRRSAPSDDCLPGLCCKHTLRINISQSMPWIQVPKMFEAGICIGNCPNLYRYRYTWTYFASQSSKKRLPCCVPTNFSQMSIIYYDDNRLLISEKIENAIVDSCGCT